MRTAKKLAVAMVACCAAVGLRLSCEEPRAVTALFQKLRSAQTTNAAAEELEKLGKSDSKAREYLAIQLPAVIRGTPASPG